MPSPGIDILEDAALDGLLPLQLTAFTDTVVAATVFVQVTVMVLVVNEVTPAPSTLTPLGFVTTVPIGNAHMYPITPPGPGVATAPAVSTTPVCPAQTAAGTVGVPGAVGTGMVTVADAALEVPAPLQFTPFTVTEFEPTIFVQVTVIAFVVVEVTPLPFTVTPVGFVTTVPTGKDQI